MKFSDINENLTEAPEGMLARAATAVKKKVGPTKKIRQRAAGRQSIQKQALGIKDQFHTWAGENSKGSSVEDFKAFASENYPKLAAVIDNVAAELKFAKSKPESEPKPKSDDSADQQANAVDPEQEQEDMISPEEMTGEKGKPGEQSEEEIRAAYGKKGDELEAKRKAQGGELADESVEEDADDAEPKVDMSASIYEARLNRILMLERDLKDNQLDTLIFRSIQAAGANKRPDHPDSPKAKAAAKAKSSEDEISQTADKISNASSDDEYTASVRGDSSVLDEYADELEDILRAVANGKDISSNQKGYAQAILDEL